MGTEGSGGAAEGSTKEIILSRALRLFAEKGYEGTTVQDIADAVGIKAASLYAHFSGKDDIFASVLSRAVESWDAAMREAFTDAMNAPGLEDGLVRLISRYVTHAAGADTFGFWTRIYVFPPRVITEEELEIIGRLDDRFGEHVHEICLLKGVPGRGNLDRLVGTIVRLTWGFMLCDGRENAGGIEDEVRESLKMILSGFCGTGGERP